MLHIRVKLPGGAAPVIHNHECGPFDIGRAAAAEAVPRCVVACDQAVSRDHIRLEELPKGQMRVENTSKRKMVRFPDGDLQPGETRVVDLPATLQIGNTTVAVDWFPDEEVELDTLRSLRAPPLLRKPGEHASPLPRESVEPAVIAEWFETLITVQQAPVGSPEFYQQTAKALVDHIGMDVGLVLLRQAGGWRVVARASTGASSVDNALGREFSMSVLEHVLKVKRTVFNPDEVNATESLSGVTALVAAPVLDPTGEVMGAVYGVRRKFRGPSVGITRLEAQMAQVLATAVGVGLARAAQQEELTRMQVQFRQHFTDQIARQLALDTDALEGQDREITVLFADIRSFSRMSEKLGPQETFRLVSEVLTALTEAVHRHNGTVMDYVGDELIALWNAPLDQPNHAREAAACAMEMETDLAPVSRAWEVKTGQPVRVGVGVSTGPARVGNTGTRYKFKYGALGHTVNLASRLQCATREFGCGILLSGTTRAALPPDAPTRRVGRVRVVGIEEPVELFQLTTPIWSVSPEVQKGYAEALARFEAGDLAGADASIKAMSPMPLDCATRLLAARVESLLQANVGATYPPILELHAK
jgi:adenylate cyclase